MVFQINIIYLALLVVTVVDCGEPLKGADALNITNVDAWFCGQLTPMMLRPSADMLFIQFLSVKELSIQFQ